MLKTLQFFLRVAEKTDERLQSSIFSSFILKIKKTNKTEIKFSHSSYSLEIKIYLEVLDIG